MCIIYEDSSVDISQGSDDKDQHPEKYEERKNTVEVELEQTNQEKGNTHDDDSTDKDSEEDEKEDIGKFKDEDYEGVVFV